MMRLLLLTMLLAVAPLMAAETEPGEPESKADIPKATGPLHLAPLRAPAPPLDRVQREGECEEGREHPGVEGEVGAVGETVAADLADEPQQRQVDDVDHQCVTTE